MRENIKRTDERRPDREFVAESGDGMEKRCGAEDGEAEEAA